MLKDTAPTQWGVVTEYDYLTLDYGQALNWKFAWDTSTITGVAVNDVTVTFRVYDGNATNGFSQSAVNIDIVPYILEVVTPLSSAYKSNPSAFDRSANGWYPARENDSITINGFNLGTGTATTAVTLNGTDITAGSTISMNQIVVNVGQTAASGALVVAVGPAAGSRVESLNNRNTDTNTEGKKVDYNQEPNNLNNNTLNDDRNLYVWNTGYLLNKSIVNNPFMRMAANGTRVLSFGVYENVTGRLQVMSNNTYQGTNAAGANGIGNYLEASANRYVNNTVAVDDAGRWYAGSTNMTSSGNPRNFTLYTGSNTGESNTADGVNKRRLLSISDNGATNGNYDSNRVRIPRIIARTTNGTTAATNAKAARIFMSYNDSIRNEVVFRYGLVGDSLTSPMGADGNLPPIGTTAANGTGSFGSIQVVANDSSTYQGSNYTAVDGLSNGLPVIAWYDRTNQKLLFSHGGTSATAPTLGTGVRMVPTAQATNTTGTGTTTTRYYTIAGHGLTLGDSVVITQGANVYTQYVVRAINNDNVKFATNTTTNTANDFYNQNSTAIIVYRTADYNGGNIVTTTTGTWQSNAVEVDTFKGTHVDMAVDAGDNIHLAYYDVSNGGLWYAYIAKDQIGNGVNTKVERRSVDTYLAAGTKLMINVRNDGTRDVPYISYYHASFAETKNAIRVAWPVKFAGNVPLDGTNSDDSFTGAWEVMTVPVGKVPVPDEFVCSGVPATTGGWAAPGGTSTLRTYTVTGTNHLNRSIMVGYMTTDWYEGAILKKDLY
jgi:hypothetical protein